MLFLKLFIEDKSNCLAKTSGHFCAAVWDSRHKRLCLYLDRTGGIKTLYYATIPGGFLFSSKLHELVYTRSHSRELNVGALHELFSTGYILPPNTLLKGIYKLCPGEQLSFENGKIHHKIVDRIKFQSRGSNLHEGAADHAEELTQLLAGAIRKPCYEAKPGFLLSGGLDSSILVSIASRYLKKHVRAYTAAFPGSTLDESRYAQFVAHSNHFPLHLFDLSCPTLLEDLPSIIWHLGEPFLDFSVIPTYHLFRNIRKHNCNIIIGGDGPDHLFGRYYPLAAKRYFGAKYSGIIQLLSKLPLNIPSKIREAGVASLSEAYRGLWAIPAWGRANYSLYGSLNIPDAEYRQGHEYYYSLMGLPEREDSQHFVEYFDALSLLDFYVDGSQGVFTKVGRMAEAHGLSLREPYLDREVSDFIAQLPLREKQFGNLFHFLTSRAGSKQLLRNVVGPRFLSKNVLAKRKGGFTPPLAEWLRQSICKIPVNRLISRSVAATRYLNLDRISRILAEHLEAVRDWSQVIFIIISFDLWHRMFVENDNRTLPPATLSEIYDLP